MKKISRVSFAHYKKNIENASFSIKTDHTNSLHQNLIDAQEKYSSCGGRKQLKTVPNEISTYNFTFIFKSLFTNRKITLCPRQVAQC
jgi:hypothetical protein